MYSEKRILEINHKLNIAIFVGLLVFAALILFSFMLPSTVRAAEDDYYLGHRTTILTGAIDKKAYTYQYIYRCEGQSTYIMVDSASRILNINTNLAGNAMRFYFLASSNYKIWYFNLTNATWTQLLSGTARNVLVNGYSTVFPSLAYTNDSAYDDYRALGLPLYLQHDYLYQAIKEATSNYTDLANGFYLTNKNSIDANKKEYEGIVSVLNTVNTNVSSNKTTLGTVNTNVSSIKTTLGTVNTNVSSIITTLGSFDKKIDDIDIYLTDSIMNRLSDIYIRFDDFGGGGLTANQFNMLICILAAICTGIFINGVISLTRKRGE